MEKEIMPGPPLPPPEASVMAKVIAMAKIGYDTFTSELPKELSKTEAGQKVLDGSRKVTHAIGDAYDGASNAGSKLVDNLSGAEAMMQIESLLNQQRRYNDVLATRLAEALARIDKLEDIVKGLPRER